MLKVYVDFNTELDHEQGYISINTVVQPDLLEALSPQLPLLLYDEEMEVEAIAYYDAKRKRWYGIPDWPSRRLKVHVDFNTEADHEQGYISINTVVQPDLLKILRPEMPLLLYDTEMQVEAVAYYDADFKWWYGIPDWTTLRDETPYTK